MNRCLLCIGGSFIAIKPTFGGKHIGRCSQCGFVQVYPHASAQECAALYDDDWEHFAPYISQIPAHRHYFQQLLRFVTGTTKKPIRTLLDIGCALGVLLEEAKTLGIRAEGIDISTDAVSYGKKHHLHVSHNTCALWEKKGRHTNAYDVITALEVIEHEQNPLVMVRSMFGMLCPGGMVVLTTPNFNTVFRVLMGNSWVGYQHTEHLWFFTPKSITELLSQAGFSDIQVRKDFYRPYSVSYMFKRLGDYVPVLRFVTNTCAAITKRLMMTLPFNPWGDMLVTAKKH